MKFCGKLKLLAFPLSLFFILTLLVSCAKQNNFKPYLKNPQDATAYLNPTTENVPILSSADQKALFKRYLNHHYSPWTNKDQLFSHQDIENQEQLYIQSFTKEPGWSENRHPHSQQWIRKIITNMNMGTFPNRTQKAITLHSDNMRVLPTNRPTFSSMTKPGNTYPFDNFQQSYISANLPVEILQTTQDGAWDLVLTNTEFGWLPTKDLATVNQSFIKSWTTKQHIAFNNDHISIYDNKGNFRFLSRLGTIYPLKQVNKHHYKILIAVSNSDKQAIIKTATLSKKNAVILPLTATPLNIALMANQFLGTPYGWGGLYGYRDCSATTMNLMTYFGLWLPRNSKQQAEIGGTFISLKDIGDTQKKRIIQKEAIPFLTLVRIPGHIMLYLGKKGDHLYVFHDMWGLGTKRLFRSAGRAVVGKTVITPLNFGSVYINVPDTLIDNVSGIVLLGKK